jgi:hypothetical protein
VLATVVKGCLESLTPLSVIFGAIVLFEAMEQTQVCFSSNSCSHPCTALHSNTWLVGTLVLYFVLLTNVILMSVLWCVAVLAMDDVSCKATVSRMCLG